ncbi:MAG: hypothetical protein WB902_31930, partial [Acetobacteraceae bacterium]|jgi:hypothetical protein
MDDDAAGRAGGRRFCSNWSARPSRRVMRVTASEMTPLAITVAALRASVINLTLPCLEREHAVFERPQALFYNLK